MSTRAALIYIETFDGFDCGNELLSTYTKLSMMFLLPLNLKDVLFIALFSNIYQGEHNHLVLKFILTTSVYIYD